MRAFTSTDGWHLLVSSPCSECNPFLARKSRFGGLVTSNCNTTCSCGRLRTSSTGLVERLIDQFLTIKVALASGGREEGKITEKNEINVVASDFKRSPLSLPPDRIGWNVVFQPAHRHQHPRTKLTFYNISPAYTTTFIDSKTLGEPGVRA